MQTYDGGELYPSLEEKAAHLLYFLVKNHSFVDDNKRIAVALFLRFMEKNRLLYREDGSRRIADNARMICSVDYRLPFIFPSCPSGKFVSLLIWTSFRG